jgi:hypothetical protein
MSTPDEAPDMERIIAIAVAAWHDVADVHAFKHCNCFRHQFVTDLIAAGLFKGYQPDNKKGPAD